jgi:hypothetical protein
LQAFWPLHELAAVLHSLKPLQEFAPLHAILPMLLPPMLLPPEVEEHPAINNIAAVAAIAALARFLLLIIVDSPLKKL